MSSPTSLSRRLRAFARWASSPSMPYLVGAVAAAAGLLFWHALRLQQAERIEQAVATTAAAAAGEIEGRIDAMVRAIQLLTEHGLSFGWSSPEEWRSDARLNIGAFPGFETMEWINGRFRPQVVASEDPEPRGLTAGFEEATLLEQAYLEARESAEPVVVGPFAFEDGGVAFRIIVPLLAARHPEAYLSAVFAVDETLGQLSEHLAPGHWLEVRCEGWSVFRHGAAEPVSARRWWRSQALELPGGFAWEVVAAPRAASAAIGGFGLPGLALVLSLSIAGLLTLTLRFGQMARLRAHHFEAAVRQRTEELEVAKGEAESANAAKDRFLAMVSHELRNPLGSVGTALEVLGRHRPEESTYRRMRRIMERQVHHLGRLVDDLLDVSRIERGKLAIELRRLDLVRLLREAAGLERQRIEAAGLELRLELPERQVWVDADPTRLVQVVGNLLSNARKFTDAGGEIELRVEAGDERAIVAVRDTGVGLGEEELEAVFEPFAQGASRRGGGLGLGLPIVRGLVEAHGGEVEVASEGRGRGAEFRVRLPLRSAPEETSAPPPARAAPEGRRVAVIDDHRDSADSLRELLELMGHRAEVAYGGARGVELVRRRRPDVVICDLDLPEMDGFAVAEAVRSDPETAATQLVALTGYGDDETARRVRESGFDVHLTKPVDPAKLEEILSGAAEASGRPQKG